MVEICLSPKALFSRLLASDTENAEARHGFAIVDQIHLRAFILLIQS